MKKFTLVLFLFYFSLVHAQRFHSLDGIENQQSETILLYRLGTAYYPFNPVYKLNTATLTQQLIIHAYSYDPNGTAKTCYDFEFFPGDENNFMNVGWELYPDNHSYIARNDSTVYGGGFSSYNHVDISKQNPLKVYAFPEGIARSFDGGFTFPVDSIIPVTDWLPLSLADFDDEVIFGLNNESRLIKGTVVDTAAVFYDEYFKMLYDVNLYHVYRVNKTYYGYIFKVSNNRGDAFTWSQTYQSENPLLICIDPSQSGLIYLADGNKIYKSADNGYNFTLYKTIEHRITGIYKKPGSEIMYASTGYRIYKITPGSTEAIKSLPMPPELYDWFPMTAGNFMVYDVYPLNDNCWSIDPPWSFASVITGDTLINGKTYFKFYPPIAYGLDFLRIDSLEGKVKAYNTSYGKEENFYDFLMEVGDEFYRDPENPDRGGYTLYNEDTITVFNELRTIRQLTSTSFDPTYSLVKGIGYYKDIFCEFGGWSQVLRGCVLNNIVRGDTTLLSVEDITSVPTEFNLYQNYPNPFNPVTTFKYAVPTTSSVNIRIFDILGNEIGVIVNEIKAAGTYEVNWNAAGISSGVYIYRLTSVPLENRSVPFTSARKMILLR